MKVNRELEGDYSTGPSKHPAPPPRWRINWPAVTLIVIGLGIIATWRLIFRLAGVI